MLIIGHRGAAGEKPENTLAAIRAGRLSGADMLELDVRLTKDKQLILCHDKTLHRTHGIDERVRDLTLKEIRKRTAGSDRPICTLEEVFEDSLGKIFLNIELKEKGTGRRALALLSKPVFKGHRQDIMFSSFLGLELLSIRRKSKRIKLAMLMKLNPFVFIAWERVLKLSAVGFHRLHIHPIALETAQKMDLLVYVYTVNRAKAIEQLEQKGIDAITTDYPSTFSETK